MFHPPHKNDVTQVCRYLSFRKNIDSEVLQYSIILYSLIIFIFNHNHFHIPYVGCVSFLTLFLNCPLISVFFLELRISTKN